MNLTPHFTLAELTASNKARSLGIDNTPAPELLPRLVRTAEMLERIRATLGVPVLVTSGYRCPTLNRAVGGVATSDHTQGHAADFVAPRFGPPAQIAKSLAPLVDLLGIGQLIYEHLGDKAWVHVSTHTPEKPANRVITLTSSGASLGIQP
jgi:hypothetical protein